VGRELDSIQKQIKQTKDNMAGLSDPDRQTLDQKAAYDQEEVVVQQWVEELDVIRSQLEQLRERTSTDSESNPDWLNDHESDNDNGLSNRDELPDVDLMRKMREELNDLMITIDVRARTSIDEIDALLNRDSSFGELLQTFEERHEAFETKYKSVRERADAYSEQMEQLDELDKRREALRILKKDIEDQLEEIGKPNDKFKVLRNQWLDVHRRQSDILSEQCDALTDQSQKLIRAHLEVGGQTNVFVELFRAKMEGANLYRSTIESIFASIPKAGDPIEQYSAILQELELLASHETDEGGELPDTPQLEACELSTSHVEKIAEYLTPEDWLDIAVAPLDDQPRFEYKVGQDYIDFSSASAGQQATALLLALLNQSGPPLVIDQPEDDLDNQIILDVVGEIWSAKSHRQLIFASHSANLVVNGDADLVVCFDNTVKGDSSSGDIVQTGAIDMEPVRKSITDIMEGGPEAFELRKAKYGF